MTSAPDQDAAQIGSAGAPPVLCSLETINEDMEMEDHQEEEAGLSCTAAAASAHQPSDAVQAAEGRTEQLHVRNACEAPAHGGRIQGGQRFGEAEQSSKEAMIPTGCSDRQLLEKHSQQALVSSKQHAPRGDSEQDKGAVRRSGRRAVLAAQPVSAQGQAARPRALCIASDGPGCRPSRYHSSLCELRCASSTGRMIHNVHWMRFCGW